MGAEDLLVQDYCKSTGSMVKCLKGYYNSNSTISPDNSTADATAICSPQWMLNRCLPGCALGETQEVPCAFVILTDGINQVFVPDGVGSIHAHCNATTGAWDIKQTCIIKLPSQADGNSSVAAGIYAGNNTFNPAEENNVPHLLNIYTTLRFITTGGHAISLISLIIAILLFSCMRRLHCMRVTIHINLMVTFLLRAVLWYLHFPVTQEDNYDIDDMGRLFSQKHNVSDLPWVQTIYDDNCLPKSYYSWCRVHTIFLNYTILANNFWILIEGIYLWILLQAFSMPTRKTMVGFLIFGWICPWIPIAIYCLNIDIEIRTECWNVNDCKEPQWWILKTPMLISLVTNFVFFIMVLKIVASKLRFNHSSSTQGSSNSYKWRLAKATLSLIPLLGISYLLTMFVQCNSYETTAVIAVKYFENFFNSVQGFLVAVIYCFLNTEIREEFAKLRRSWQLKKELGRMRTDQRPQASMGNSNYYNQDASNVTNMTSWSERDRPEEGVSITLLPVITNGKPPGNKETHLSPCVSIRNEAALTEKPPTNNDENGSQTSKESSDSAIAQTRKLIENN